MDLEDSRPLDHSLLQKIHESLMTIAIAVEPIKNSENLLLAFNGGKDTCILLHLLHVLFDKSTKNPILQSLSENGIDISELIELKSSFKIENCRYAFFEFSTEDEFPEIIDFCRNIEKDYGITIEKYENKIKNDLELLVKEQGITTVLIGNRRTDPYSEHLKPIQKSSEGWPDFTRVHPILDWEYSEVWRFILHFKVKVCSLYI